MNRNKIHGIIFIVIVSAALSLQSGPIEATDYKLHHNPKEYVLGKFQSHDLVLLGTRHKREPILQFISKLIPSLYDVGVIGRCGCDSRRIWIIMMGLGRDSEKPAK